MLTAFLRFAWYGGLFIVGAAGLSFLITEHSRLTQLRQEHRSLTQAVLPLTITDPDKVHISAIPSSIDTLPPGIDKAFVWRFRIYLPAGYARCLTCFKGRIAADSPTNHSGSSGSSRSARQTAEESQMTLAMVRTTEGDWTCFQKHRGSSGSLSARWMQDHDSLDEMIIEPIVKVGEEAKVFNTDEVICLFRIRTPNPIINRRTKEPEKQNGHTLYHGMVTYLMDESRKADFDAWTAGKTDTLEKPQ